MSSNAKRVWSACLEWLQSTISAQPFETWFKPTVGHTMTQNTFTIEVPNQFFADWLEEHHLSIIKRALTRQLGFTPLVSFQIEEEMPKTFTREPVSPLPITTNKPLQYENNLNSEYTFDNFVVGSCNQFAHAAALAVAEAPGKTAFNPLVIYGGVGLGKTHIAQAIGHHSAERGVVERFIYVASEKFTIEFIDAIQQNKTRVFTQIYRNVDLLLVDDIQFFCHGHKNRTQEEFFHIFDTLRQNGKQIVLTSDRPPRELLGLEERLISRFQWGLLTDLQIPDYETRIAILQRKADRDGLEIPMDVTAFIATHIASNIRDLEGALIRLLAYASLAQCDLTIEVAKEVLKDTIDKQTRRKISIEAIQKKVANQYEIPTEVLIAKTRKKEISLARQVAMYLSRRLTNTPLKEIGQRFGGRDHTTVIHACQTITQMMKKDPQLQGLVNRIERSLM